MNRILSLLRAGFLVFAGLSVQAGAASAVEIQCAEHKQIVGLLAKKYSENPVAMGTVNDDRYMQVFVSTHGSWTVLVTHTNGLACIVAAGQNWEKMPVLAKAGPAA